MAFDVSIPVFDCVRLGSLPDHPLILKGFRPEACCDSLDSLLARLGGPVVQGYRRDDGDSWQEMTAAALAAAFRQGRLDMNVVDFPIGPDLDPADAFSVPEVMERDNLLLMDPEWRVYRKSLVITQHGTRTEMHVDSCGLGGWMYLFAGRKRWECWHAAVAPMFYDLVAGRYYDERAGHPHTNPDGVAALAGLPVWSGEIGPGDLLWFPEGWLHRVETFADSFGYGGSTLHALRAGQAAQAWRWEQRLGYSAGADLAALLARAAEAGYQVAEA